MQISTNHYQTASTTQFCTCLNPQVASITYPGMFDDTEIYKDTSEIEIEMYTKYINCYNAENNLPPVTSVMVNKHITWLSECLECKKSLESKRKA